LRTCSAPASIFASAPQVTVARIRPSSSLPRSTALASLPRQSLESERSAFQP